MKRLLIVHHTPSPNLQAMYEAVRSGATTDEIEGVEVISRPALTASPVDVLKADGYLLGLSPAGDTASDTATDVGSDTDVDTDAAPESVARPGHSAATRPIATAPVVVTGRGELADTA